MTETTTGTYTCEITKEAGTLTLEEKLKRLVSKMSTSHVYAWDPDLYEFWNGECPECLRQDGKHNSRCPKGKHD